MEAHIELRIWNMIPGSYDEVKCLKPICLLLSPLAFLTTYETPSALGGRIAPHLSVLSQSSGGEGIEKMTSFIKFSGLKLNGQFISLSSW